MKGIFRPNAYALILMWLVSEGFLSGCGKSSTPPTAVQNNTNIAVLTVSETPVYDFGIQFVNSVTEKTFIVSNLGVKPATEMAGSFYLSVAFAYKDGAYPGTGGTCSTSLATKSTCTVVITFSPKYVGVTETVVNIDYNNASIITATSGPVLHGQGN